MNTKLWKGIFWGLILVLPFWLWAGSQAWGTVYYMRADGTAANATVATGPGSTQANCMTIAVHNAASFSGDDVINICDDGGVFRDQMDLPSNGTSGHPIIYQVETGDSPVISGTDLVTSWSIYETKKESYEETADGSHDEIRKAADRLKRGQSFTAPSSFSIGEVKFYLKKVGSPTGNIFVEVFNDSGSSPNNEIGQSDNVDVSTLTTGFTQISFSFTTKPAITNGNDYWVVVSGDWTVSATNYAILGSDNCDPKSHSGQICYYTGAAWGTSVARDIPFEVWEITDDYKATLATEPVRVWHSSTELTANNGSYGSLSANEWDWNANVLYIDISQNPTGETIEAGIRTACVNLQKNYITLDGIILEKAKHHNIRLYDNASNNVIVKNCTIRYAGACGMLLGQDGTKKITNWTIDSNDINNNGIDTLDHGIYINYGDSNTIQNNVLNNNYGFAIQLQDDADDNTIRYNHSTNCGQSGATGGFIVISNNAANCTGNSIYNNISNGDVQGLFIYEVGNDNNLIYGNVFYGYTLAGIDSETAASNTIKNNIIYSSVASTKAFDLAVGCTFTVSDYNVLGPESANYITYDGNNYSTLAAYVAAESQGSHSIKSDPLFTNAAGDDFTLDPRSPCINAGTIPSGFESIYPLDPRLTVLNPWSPIMMPNDVKEREIGAYGYIISSIIGESIVGNIIEGGIVEDIIP